MSQKPVEVSYRKLSNQNGILISQGIWLFNSPEEWVAEGGRLEAAGELEVVPFIDPPSDVDWKRESVLLVSGGDQLDGPRRVVVTGVFRHGNRALVTAELQSLPGGAARMLPCEVGVVNEKHLKSAEVEWILP